MKAAVLTKLNAPLEVLNLALPDHLEYGQVLVRVLVSGICGAQLQEIRGEKGTKRIGGYLVDPYIPHLLGHEGCGVVEAVGAGVCRVKPGDKVVMHWRKAEGIEANCAKYTWWKVGPSGGAATAVNVGGGRVITLCEQAVVSENRVTPVPPDTSPELCALLGCSLSTALGTVEREASIEFGESVLIVGTGGLGCNLIKAALLAHAHPIVAMDIRPGKKRTALALGATAYIDALKDDLSKVGKFDVVVDTAGAGSSMADTLPLLAPSGRFILVGHPPPGADVLIKDADHLFGGEGKSIKATQGGGFLPHLDIPRYVRMWQSGTLDVSGIVTDRLPLRLVNKGIEKVKAGNASRVLIDMRLKT